MKLKFSKMHGISNDYVYVNGFTEKVENPERVSQMISDRHTGIGSDGLVLILPSEQADLRMRMFNADGSEGAMCGNATRCIGKYAYEHGLVKNKELTLETKSGIKYLSLTVEDGKVVLVKVDMGKAILNPADIPVLLEGEQIVSQPIVADGVEYRITCVSMGNPHAVIFVDEDVMNLDLNKIGPGLENHPLFPERINTEFVRVIDDHTLEMRVYERGSGETWACGTGACATVVAAVLNGHVKKDEDITVRLRGGDLMIRWAEDGTVFMTGPATHVFDGEMEIED